MTPELTPQELGAKLLAQLGQLTGLALAVAQPFSQAEADAYGSRNDLAAFIAEACELPAVAEWAANQSEPYSGEEEEEPTA